MRQADGNDKPAYAVIYSAFRKMIFQGELNPGDGLPSENSLCEQYGVSRETVRKGLKQLEAEGLIHSEPHRGYYVNNPQHNELTITLVDDLEDCWSKYRDVHGVHPDDEVRAALAVGADAKVIKFARASYDGDYPVAYDVKYIPYDRAYPSVESEISYAVFPDIAAAKVKPFGFHTKVEVRAAGAKGEVADALECPEGEPLLLITRWYIQHDGQRIAYGKQYLKQPYGKLTGTLGYQFDERGPDGDGL